MKNRRKILINCSIAAISICLLFLFKNIAANEAMVRNLHSKVDNKSFTTFENKNLFNFKSENSALNEKIDFYAENDIDNIKFKSKVTIKNGEVKVKVISSEGIVKWEKNFKNVKDEKFNIEINNIKSGCHYMIDIKSEYSDYIKLDLENNDDIIVAKK